MCARIGTSTRGDAGGGEQRFERILRHPPAVQRPRQRGIGRYEAMIGARAPEPLRPSWLRTVRSEEHTSELQSLRHLVCRLLLEKKKKQAQTSDRPTHPTDTN